MRGKHINSCKLILLLSAALASSPLSAQSTGAEPDPVLQNYAETYGTTYEEAASRFRRLADITRVDKELAAKFPNQFGGLFIEHQPTFRVVVKMTGAGQGLLKQVTGDALYVVEKAIIPIQQLNQLKERVGKTLASDGTYYFAANVNVWDGVVEVRSTDMDTVKRVLPANIVGDARVRFIPVTFGAANTASIYGGRAMTGTQNCTSGFTAVGSGGAGIVTAGHCANSLTLSGVSFTVVQEVYKTDTNWGFDFQFMRPTGGTHTFPNEAYNTSTTREVITAKTFAGDLPLGATICAYGAVTNALRCGTLAAKWEVKRDNNGITSSVFRAAPTGTQTFVQGGDSGGPVYGPGTAYGIIKGTGDSANPKHMSFVDIIGLETTDWTIVPAIKTAP
jgi:hypothetical protein